MPTAFALFGGALGLVGLIVAALVVARSTITKGTIQLLQDDQQALRSRVETLTTENTLLRERVEALEHTKEELFLQVKSLPAFALMAESMQHVATSMTELREETRAMNEQLLRHLMRMEER